MNRRQMNHPARIVPALGIVFTIVILIAGPAAVAQPAATAPSTAPAALPAPGKDVKTAATLTPAQSAAVKAFVKNAAARLAFPDDPDGTIAARNDMVNASIAGGPLAPPSVAYLTEYLTDLNTELKALATSPSARVKVNAGIVATRVMANVNAVMPPTALVGATESLMNDPSDGVALWGVKAAGNLINSPGGVPNAAVVKQLLKDITAAVDNHHLNGAITDEAYVAMQAVDPQVIVALIQLYGKRIDAYKNNGLPPDPTVDHRPSSYFVAQNGMWKAMTPQQQAQVAGLISQLLTEADAAMNRNDISTEAIEQLRSLLVDTGKAIAVIGTTLGDAQMFGDGIKLTRLTNLTPAQITPLVQPCVADLQRAFPANSPAVNVAKP